MQLKSCYLTSSLLLGVSVTLCSISTAQAHDSYRHVYHTHRHVHHKPVRRAKHKTYVHHEWVYHDVYVAPPSPVYNTAAPANCPTPSNSPAAAPSGYRTQHKFLVNDNGISTSQSAAPRVPSQQVQFNYYDE